MDSHDGYLFYAFRASVKGARALEEGGATIHFSGRFGTAG